jgi:molybdate transport system ATP-binding protein
MTRPDVSIRIGENACAILEATIGVIDKDWHLVRLDFPDGCLWCRDPGLAVGRRVRVRVLARDVSVAGEKPSESSMQNVLCGTVESIGEDEHPGLALVGVRIGGSRLVARVTRRAVAELKLGVEQVVWVQVKSVALLE